MHETFLESKKVIVVLLRENIESVEDPRFAKREINAVDVFFQNLFKRRIKRASTGQVTTNSVSAASCYKTNKLLLLPQLLPYTISLLFPLLILLLLILLLLPTTNY